MDTELTACTDINGATHLVPTHELISRDAVYAIIFKAGRLLMIRDRSAHSRWDLPGGGVEYRESEIEALHREVLEETGLLLEGSLEFAATVVEHFFDIESGKAWKSRRSFFCCSVSGQHTPHGNADDITSACWLDPRDTSYEVAPTVIEVLRFLKQ